MYSASSFKEFFEASLAGEKGQANSKQLSEEFFSDFIHFTPIHLELMELYLSTGHIDLFYKSLADLKYLVEYSDSLNRYWFLMRGYSGALSKLKANQTIKASKKIYGYYIKKYGGRRLIRNEHWFEKQRWEFLDELQLICTEDELEEFIRKYQQIMSENFKIYVSFLRVFINNLKNL
ncbi:MAG: hypothetical protein Q8N05_00495 [Bacteroidota bacterium]|nr:hypothetical protein [Bacteroidota bacterium]